MAAAVRQVGRSDRTCGCRLARRRRRPPPPVRAPENAGIGPPAQALATVIKANGRVLASGDFLTIARSDDADFVAQLYAAGALLVVDAEQAGGCTGLPPKRSTAKL